MVHTSGALPNSGGTSFLIIINYIIQSGDMRCAAENDVEVWSGLDNYIKHLKAHGGHYYAPTPEDLKTLEKAFSPNWKEYERNTVFSSKRC